MTDKEKVIQLLLDNGFKCTGKYANFFRNEDFRVSYSHLTKDFGFVPFNDEDVEILESYFEVVGFLYLKYGKVNISEK